MSIITFNSAVHADTDKLPQQRLWYRYIYTIAEVASVACIFAINPTVYRLPQIHPVCTCWNKIVHCRMSRWQSSAPHLSVPTGLPTMAFAATRNYLEEHVCVAGGGFACYKTQLSILLQWPASVSGRQGVSTPLIHSAVGAEVRGSVSNMKSVYTS